MIKRFIPLVILIGFALWSCDDNNTESENESPIIPYKKVIFDNDGSFFTIGIEGDSLALLKTIMTKVNNDKEPMYSPDGAKILFYSMREGGNLEIYLMNEDGSDVTRITQNLTNNDSEAIFSPDGMKIAYYSDGSIYTINADGSNNTLFQTDASHPLFTPDGNNILYNKMTADGYAIYINDINGGNEIELGLGDVHAVSPDGQKLAFRNSGRLYLMDINGSNSMLLVDNSSNTSIISSTVPEFSPQGNKIFFTALLESNNQEIFSINIDGTELMNHTLHTAQDNGFTISPDSKYIVFLRIVGSSRDLMLLDVESNTTTLLLEGKTNSISKAYFHPTSGAY